MNGMSGVGLACLLAVQTAAVGATMKIDPDRMAQVDGKRTFILGLYENPSDDAQLKAVAEAGFNLVHAAPDAAALDRLHALGLGAWINTGGAIDLSVNREVNEAALRDMAAAFAGHPALLVWEVPDEALWNCWYSVIDWRGNHEPAAQSKAIEALEDKALAGQLQDMRAEAGRLNRRGAFRASEDIIDEIWRKLGQEAAIRDLHLDESAARAAKMCGGMMEGYALLRQLDGAHPVWMNHAPRNQIDQLAAFNRAADIVGCDIYPVPAYRCGHSDLRERSLAAVGAYTERMQEAAPGKPVWMVLQAFGWADLQSDPSEEETEEQRRPTFDESRFMAYDAIVRGARGILYWGSAYIEKDSPLWSDLLKLVAELAQLQPVLSAPDLPLPGGITLEDRWGSRDRTVQVLAKEVDGKAWFFVVNESTEPQKYTIHGLEGLNGLTFADPADEREVTVADGLLTLDIQSQGVQVLTPQ